MYSNTSAQIRGDLQIKVEEAMGADSKFIAAKVLPAKFSKREAGEYHYVGIDEGELLTGDFGNEDRRAPKTAYKEIEGSYQKKAFQTVDRGLTEVVDDSDAKRTAPSFDSEVMAIKRLTRRSNISYEKRVADLIQNTTNFGAAASPVAAYTEANIDTIDFAADLGAALLKVDKRGEIPNAVIITGEQWERIRRSTKLRKFIFGDLGGSKQVTLKLLNEQFSDQFNLTFMLASATYSDAKKGKASDDTNLKSIWSNSMIFVGRVDMTGNVAAPTTGDGNGGIITLPDGVGSTIVWEEDAGSLMVTETYRDEHRRSDILRVRRNCVEHVFNSKAGALFNTNWA